MDVKDITWVGGVYLKFESMCLEAEENMYEDTVKFVEDQVLTVGASVKKFYADVMQDLMSDSSTDPEKISASGLPVKHNFDVGNSKKSKVKKEEPVKVDVEHLNGDSEVIAVLNKDVDQNSSFLGQPMYEYCMLSSDNCAEEACSDLYSRQDCDGSILNNADLVFKENPIKHRFPRPFPPVERILNVQSSSCRETREASCKHIGTVITPSIAEGMACDSMREGHVIANASQWTADVSIGCRSSDMIVLDKPDGNEWKEILDSSFGGLSEESNGSSPIGHVHYERNADKGDHTTPVWM